MARFGIFRTPKPQKFDYVPRYYDPEKEELKARLERYKPSEEQDQSTEAMKARIRAGLNSPLSIDRRFKRRAHRKSGYRVALIALALTCLFAYLIWDNRAVLEEFLR